MPSKRATAATPSGPRSGRRGWAVLYGPGFEALDRRGAAHFNRILKPASALGITTPRSPLLRADEVIQ